LNFLKPSGHHTSIGSSAGRESKLHFCLRLAGSGSVAERSLTSF
jgi:hypothetical protein